jgi:hypothetical protein
MKRIISIAISCLLIASLVGCAGSAEDAESGSVVYSMSGSNDLFEISNGVIVLGEEEEVFDGGDLKILQEDLFSDVTAYTCSYYTITNGERRTILSNSTVDMTGGTLNVNGDLGRASGNGILIGNKIKSAEDLENVIWFELITTDLSGKENTYQLALVLNKVA